MQESVGLRGWYDLTNFKLAACAMRACNDMTFVMFLQAEAKCPLFNQHCNNATSSMLNTTLVALEYMAIEMHCAASCAVLDFNGIKKAQPTEARTTTLGAGTGPKSSSSSTCIVWSGLFCATGICNVEIAINDAVRSMLKHSRYEASPKHSLYTPLIIGCLPWKLGLARVERIDGSLDDKEPKAKEPIACV